MRTIEEIIADQDYYDAYEAVLALKRTEVLSSLKRTQVEMKHYEMAGGSTDAGTELAKSLLLIDICGLLSVRRILERELKKVNSDRAVLERELAEAQEPKG